MLLSVDHVTRYFYDQPVRGVVQSHRLTPSVFDGQRVIDWQVTVSDGLPGGSFRDGAGDRVQGWSVQGPLTEIEVRVTGKVETIDLAGMLRGHRELVSPLCYLDDTLPTRADTAIATLAQEANGMEATLSAAHRLSEAVAGAIAYRPGVTEAHTTAAEALAMGEGVCQDHAHALIAVARISGLPSRYVSGYLMAGSEAAAEDASHAWAEIWIEGLGWVGFDPANKCCPDDRYIRLGSGMDAQDAAPIKGISRGGARESLDVTVAVQPADQ